MWQKRKRKIVLLVCFFSFTCVLCFFSSAAAYFAELLDAPCLDSLRALSESKRAQISSAVKNALRAYRSEHCNKIRFAALSLLRISYEYFPPFSVDSNDADLKRAFKEKVKDALAARNLSENVIVAARSVAEKYDPFCFLSFCLNDPFFVLLHLLRFRVHKMVYITDVVEAPATWALTQLLVRELLMGRTLEHYHGAEEKGDGETKLAADSAAGQYAPILEALLTQEKARFERNLLEGLSVYCFRLCVFFSDLLC